MIGCLACGHDNPAGSRYCVQCGNRLQEGAPPKTRGTRPGRWVLVLPLGAVALVGAAVGLYSVLFTGETLQDYWPVSPKGRTWEYVVTATGTAGTARTGALQVTVVGEQDFEGQRAYLYEERENLGIDTFVKTYFVLSRDSIRFIGEERKSLTPLRATEQRFTFVPGLSLIQLPLRVGASWKESYKTRLTYKTSLPYKSSGQNFWTEETTSTSFITIAARERIVVPAGTFEALKVEERRSEGGDVVHTTWRAKGVGLVKSSSPRETTELREFHLPK